LAGPTDVQAATKVACVGDSITVGVGGTAAGSFPTRLGQRLGAAYQVRNFGVSGTTLLKRGNLPYWNSPVFPASDAFAPDIVLIMLGTNDSKPANWAMKAAFEGDYQEMIAHYRALPSHPTVYAVLPPPAFGPNPYMIRGPIIGMEVVPATKKAAADTTTPTIDVFTALINASGDFPDNVHPNNAGNEKIAAAIYQALAMPIAPDAGSPDAGVDAGPDAGADAGADANPASDAPDVAADGNPPRVATPDAGSAEETASPPGADASPSERQNGVVSDGCTVMARTPPPSCLTVLGLGALILLAVRRRRDRGRAPQCSRPSTGRSSCCRLPSIRC
jgi:lysophospholipase L1-like esterase